MLSQYPSERKMHTHTILTAAVPDCTHIFGDRLLGLGVRRNISIKNRSWLKVYIL